MFLGEHEHTLDEKGRLTLPAKFRDSFPEGLVLSRGLDGCVNAYAKADWAALAARLTALGSLSRDERMIQRHFFSGAAEVTPDKQGRVMIPAALATPRRPRARRRGGRRPRPSRDLGPRRLARPDRRRGREGGGCCRTPCVQARLITSRYSPTRCGACSTCSPEQAVVDATFGAGGHAELLALDLRGKGRFIAVDRDPSARAYFERFRKRAGVQARFLRGEFATVLEQLATNDVRVDAILLDLGVSSMQLDRPERGFSYAVDAPLDMRMDPSAEETAADIVNDAPERELQEIFRRYGEERYARQIARAIVRRRRREPFHRTGELVDTIKAAIPTPARFGEGHPAKRVFQALRIAVNDELGQLEEALPAAVELLRPRGRIAVISFHSLEDRIVKRFFRAEARGCVCPPDFPICACGRDPVLRVLTSRAVRPDAREVALNPRSASARLRVAEKV